MQEQKFEKERFELRANSFTILCLVGLGTVFCLFILGNLFSVYSQDFRVLYSILPTGGLILLSYRLRKQYVQQAAFLFIAATIIGPLTDAWVRGPSLNTYFFFVLPIFAASLLLGGTASARVASLVAALIFGQTALSQGILSAISLVFTPVLICLLVGTICYLNEDNILGLVNWALDIQQKDTRRAEMLYVKGEELKQALLDIQHARARLESTNIRLKQANEKTEKVSKAKSVFLSNMSHELRTPLNVVLGYTSSMLSMPQMYKNEYLPEIYRDDIQLIKDNGHYLLGLINDILDLSKIEAGKLEIHIESVNLVDIFKGVISTSLGLVKEKPVQIRPNFPTTLPRVRADPVRIRQIMLNLLSNAIKFTKAGSVTLSAQLCDGGVEVAVTDTGIGIPERALAHIFDRFQQAEHDTDKHYGGTGLGLDISRQLVQMHGSDLLVKSTIGQGSTFSFILPVYTDEDFKPESVEHREEINNNVTIFEAQREPHTQGYAVLIVEDEVSMGDIMRRTFETANYVVIVINDALEVIEVASGLLPDAIILDIQLPNIDGWELLAQLKQHDQIARIPIIVCTIMEDKQRALDLGADLYIHKPFSPEELLEQTARLLSYGTK
jgi:signal transduction histidine kinase/CheY-like chemotaxis protein